MDNNKKMKLQLNKCQAELVREFEELFVKRTKLLKEIDKLKEHPNITPAVLNKLNKIQNELI